MLKIIEPIKLNTGREFVGAGDGFCERVNANYNMMSGDIPKEKLLHVTTEPPEYYFGGDEQSYYRSQTNVNISEQNEINIVNNLINRIMVEPSFGLMYQDKVYISNALRKLGIRDEKTFMKQVYNLREEMTQTNNLIDMYFAYGQNIKNLVTEYKTYTEIAGEETTEENTYPLHLHEDIFNRLETARIYNVVENFHQDAYGGDVISNNEMMIAEQKKVFENILLKELKNDIRGESLPLIYRSENYYEDYDFTEENTSDEKITEVINAASLLSFVTNALETKITQDKSNINKWYEVRSTVTQSTHNSLTRLESHVRNEGSQRIFNITNLAENNRLLGDEINILTQLVEGDSSIESYNSLNLSFRSEGDYIDESEENINLLEERLQNNIRQNIENRIRKDEENTNINIQKETNVSISELSEEVGITHVTVDEVNTEETINNFQEELNIHNRQNIENRNLYQQMIEAEREKVQKKLSEKERKELQRRRSLEALASPKEVITTLRQEQQKADDNQAAIERKAAKATLSDRDQIFNLINQYIENPTKTIPGAIVSTDDFVTLARDIERVEMIDVERESQIVESSETVERVQREVQRELSEEIITPKVTGKVKETIENLNLTHRVIENQNVEEVAQQIIEQTKRNVNETKETEEFFTSHTVENRQNVNEQVIDMEEVNRNITQTVNNTVARSVSMFSDQIYNQIENRLELEKRRRGL